jgi:hypothetical protein
MVHENDIVIRLGLDYSLPYYLNLLFGPTRLYIFSSWATYINEWMYSKNDGSCSGKLLVQGHGM